MLTLNVANGLTLLRILLIPVLVLVFYAPIPFNHWICAALFVLASITDAFDGYLARRLGQVSSFGAFLDPVADKLMVAVVLVLLVQADPKPWLAITAAIIIGREISISALREWMAEIGQRAKIRVAGLGKVKTGFQMTALTLLLWRDDVLGLPIYRLGELLLVIAAVLTLWSMVLYLHAAWVATRAREGD